MYRILITDEIIRDSESYDASLPFDSIKRSLEKLKNEMTFENLLLNNLSDYRLFIEEIIKDYHDLQKLLPLQFDAYIKKYNSILDEKFMQTKFYASKKSKKTDTFANLIISRMRYSTDARNLILKYLKKLHFETCTYCNFSSLPITQNGNEYTQLGTLDHYKDKSSYPFLCTSFFNLFPCCGSCNGPGKKGNKKIAFYPYRERKQSVDSNPFLFTFGWSSPSVEKDVAISFREIRYHMGEYPVRRHKLSRCRYDKVFGITELYNTEVVKKKILRVERRSHEETTEQNNTAGPVSGNRLQPCLDSERVKSILDVDSLDSKDVHSEDLMKLKLDLGKDLGLL